MSDIEKKPESKTYAETLKQKYGKVYSITSEITEGDDTEEVELFFKKPQTSSYDRYLKNMSKSMMKASKAFVMDNVVDEECEKLEKMQEEYPALALGIAKELLAVLGLSDNVNLKRL